jgi:hypothetical protein
MYICMYVCVFVILLIRTCVFWLVISYVFNSLKFIIRTKFGQPFRTVCCMPNLTTPQDLANEGSSGTWTRLQNPDEKKLLGNWKMTWTTPLWENAEKEIVKNLFFRVFEFKADFLNSRFQRFTPCPQQRFFGKKFDESCEKYFLENAKHRKKLPKEFP